MDRAPFEALENLGKAANIRIKEFFDGSQSFASNLFLRRGNIERQSQILATFAWPVATVAECNEDPVGVLGHDHPVAKAPIHLILPGLEVELSQCPQYLTERSQLSQWIFRHSFASLISDACAMADSVGALLMRGYLNPRQSITRSGIKETHDWAKDQPSTNDIAKRIERMLYPHAGPNAWRVCLGLIRNDIVHGTAERLQVVDGRFSRIMFTEAGGGKSAQRQFVDCFGPDTDTDLSAFGRSLCSRIDTLIYDCTNSKNFDWPKLS